MADDKLLEVERQLDQLVARKQLLAARVAQRSRAQDTRRKILAGAVVLEQARENPDFRNWLRFRLNEALVRPADRKLFDLA